MGAFVRASYCIAIYMMLAWWVTMMEISGKHYFTKILKCSKSRTRTLITILNIDNVFTIVGGYLAEVYFGNYKTALIGISMSVVGSTMMLLSQMPTLQLPLLAFYLATYSIASIGRRITIVPLICLAMDQIQFPAKYIFVHKFFLIFWGLQFFVESLVRNLVYIMSTRMPLGCFHDLNCCFIFFYIIAATTIIQWILFVCSRSAFLKTGVSRYFFIHEAFYCFIYAGMERKTATEEQKQEKCLDYAVSLYGRKFVDHVQRMYAVLIILPMIVVFGQTSGMKDFAIFSNNLVLVMGSKQMPTSVKHFISDGSSVVLCPIIVIFCLYCMNCNCLAKDLRKVALALFILVSMNIPLLAYIHKSHKSKLEPPKSNQAHFRLFNPSNCTLEIEANFLSEKIDFYTKIEPRKHFEDFNIAVADTREFPYKFRCGKIEGNGVFSFEKSEAKSYYLSSSNTMRSFVQKEHAEEKKIMFRTIVWTPDPNLTVTYSFNDGKILTMKADNVSLNTVIAPEFNLTINKKTIASSSFYYGGSYVILVTDNSGENYEYDYVQVNSPTSLQFPVIVCIYILIYIVDTILVGYLSSFTYIESPPPAKRICMSVFYITWKFSRFIFTHLLDISLLSMAWTCFVASLGGSLALFLLSIWYDYADTTEDCNPEDVEYNGPIFQGFDD